MMQLAVANADRLIQLFNDVVDVERLANRDLVLDCRQIDVRDIVQRTVDGVRTRAESARVNIELDVESVCVMADEDRLVQALTNLAENGIKFSPADASLQIGVAVRDGAALFCVQDHGRGIPSSK